MMKKYLYLIALTISFQLPLSSCAQSRRLPAWVNNPSKKFSNTQYLMAVGAASTQEGAKKQARANLAKIFVSNVDVNESYVQEYNEVLNNNGATISEEKSHLVTRSNVTSYQQMKNVKIKRTYRSGSGTVYALAAMDRRKTARLYSGEISRNDQRIRSMLAKARQTRSRLERLIYMRRALLAGRINKMLQTQRAILTEQPTQEVSVQFSDILERYRAAQKECTVYLSGTDLPPLVSSEVAKTLQGAGFTVVKNNRHPVINLNVDLTIESANLNRQDAEFLTWSLKIAGRNKENGDWFSTYTSEGREGGLNRRNAQKRVISAVQNKIADDFPDFIQTELLSTE